MRIAAVLVLLSICPCPFDGANAQTLPAYKRRHQEVMARLERGALDEARERVDVLLQAEPNDPETYFTLTVLETLSGRLDDAERAMRRALELALPSERFMGAFRTVLVPLRGRETFDALERRFDGRVIAGPMLGRVTSTSIGCWVKTSGEAHVVLEVLDVDGAGLIRSEDVTTTANGEWTAHLEARELEPATTYRYRILSLRGETWVAEGEPVEFQTAPREGEASRFRFAFGGGAGYVPQHEGMWNTILNAEPDLLVLLGDNVYIDAPESPWLQRFTYERRQMRPEFRTLVARVPVYAIWDDHDFGTNDCVGSPFVDRPAWKPFVWNVFRSNWIDPDPPLGDAVPGSFFAFQRGDVEFVLLDGRFWRTRPKDGTSTMLGEQQKAWLLEHLARPAGTFTFLASPVPFVFEAKGQSLDTWNGFREEREEIFSHLTQVKRPGVLLLSADRHRSDLWRIEREGSYPLFEMNSSRLTNEHKHVVMKKAIFSYNATPSFGLVDVDTRAVDPVVTYRVVTLEGERVYEHAFQARDLRDGP